MGFTADSAGISWFVDDDDWLCAPSGKRVARVDREQQQLLLYDKQAHLEVPVRVADLQALFDEQAEKLPTLAF